MYDDLNHFIERYLQRKQIQFKQNNKQKKMKKILFLLFFLGFVPEMMFADNSAKAIYCAGNSTLYFVYDDNTYSSRNTYNGVAISASYDIAADGYTGKPSWATSYYYNIKNAVFTESFQNYQPTTIAHYLHGCTNLVSVSGLSNINFTNLTSIEGFFYSCGKLETIDVSSWMPQGNKVTNISSVFNACSQLTALDVSKWKTNNVTDMSYSFYNCNHLPALDVSSWNTNNVTNMSYTFFNCTSFQTLDVSGWNTSESAQVTNLSSTFNQCTNLQSLDVSGWNTSKVKDFSSTFASCNNLQSLDVSQWNTGQATTMASTFASCRVLQTLDVSNFNTANVTDMSYMFYGCNILTSLDVSSFDMTKVTNIDYMFANCPELETIYCAPGTDWSSIESSNIFGTESSYCKKLSGKFYGETCACTSGQLSSDYAKVYDGTNEGKGYFTCADNLTYTLNVIATDADGKGWATLYLDCAAEIPNTVSAVYYCTGLNDDEAIPTTTAEQITGTIPANTGVLVKTPDTGDYIFQCTSTKPAAVNGNILTGSTQATTPAENTVLTLGYETTSRELGFWYYVGSGIAANRAWVPASVLEGSSSQGVKIVFSDDTDGLDKIEMAEKAQKGVYDLQGRRMAGSNLPKGLYIVNGRKMVIK